jgi:hypothetical protein
VIKEFLDPCVPRTHHAPIQQEPHNDVRLLPSAIFNSGPAANIDGRGPAVVTPFIYFVGSIKCSYGVPGNMTYGWLASATSKVLG